MEVEADLRFEQKDGCFEREIGGARSILTRMETGDVWSQDMLHAHSGGVADGPDRS